VLGGLAISAVQGVTTVPLIHEAETYESAQTAPAPGAVGEAHAGATAAGLSHGAQAAHTHDHGGTWAPADGLERTAFTALTNVIAGFGFALLITGCFAIGRREPDAREGVLWGLAGFAVFTLAPGLGLAPELPGTAAADLTARQAWWIAAAASTAFGLWLLVFRGGGLPKALGVFVIALPHVIGAPHATGDASAVPAGLANAFAANAIAVSAVFWIVLGVSLGFLLSRQTGAQEVS
jgi:cobalt transporter subunit CbtA